MQISNIASSATTAAPSTTHDQAQVDKLQFLKLLTTQLQYQDPMNPMANTEFTAQLAQFSSLEQLTDLNKGMETLIAAQAGTANLQALSYLGHQIAAPTHHLSLPESGDAPFQVQLPDGADDVVVTVRDASGGVVATNHLGALPPGLHAAVWDGQTSDAARAATGDYAVEVGAIDADGNPVAVQLLGNQQVTGIDLSGAEPAVLTPRGSVPLSRVVQLTE